MDNVKSLRNDAVSPRMMLGKLSNEEWDSVVIIGKKKGKNDPRLIIVSCETPDLCEYSKILDLATHDFMRSSMSEVHHELPPEYR